MLRRTHKKSRGGCLECKRRHVKCDEQRPQCIICTMSDRECRYAVPSPTGQGAQTSGNTPGPEAVTPAVSTASPTPATIPDLGPVAPVSPGSLNQWDAFAGLGDPIDAPVNLDHMELIANFSINAVIPDLVDSLRSIGTSLILTTAIQHPYLLHEVLAISARHLSQTNATSSPERAKRFLHQAISLQTRAVSFFNAARPVPTEETCVAMVLFSSLIGRHVLVDTLAARGDSDLDVWLERYGQFVRIHRGIRAVASGCWPLLLGSSLAPFMEFGRAGADDPGTGTECDALRHLVSLARAGHGEEAIALTADEADAMDQAVRFLQNGFDASRDHEATTPDPAEQQAAPSWAHRMAFLWSILVPPAFVVDLLVDPARRRPEAVVVLGYYAVLLHRARRLWQIGDAGAYLLGLVERYLGPAWGPWLEYPRSVVVLGGGEEVDTIMS